MIRISEYLPTFNANNFHLACQYIQDLPYKRNANKGNILCVLEDGGGTCSTKHTLLKYLADEQKIDNVQLMMGIFMMNTKNTKKIASVLEKYHLKEIPEAHNYLKVNGIIKDYTRKNSSPEDFIDDLVEEIEIEVFQITEFKIQYHQQFIENYLLKNPHIPYTNVEFWTIREECILALQK